MEKSSVLKTPNSKGHGDLEAAAELLTTFSLPICGLLTPLGSTTVLAAIPGISSTYNTTRTIISLSNALYLVCMGIAPSVWEPFSYIYGRRPNCIISAGLFTGLSIATAVASDLAAFFAFRLLTALFGTAFFVVGSAAIGDIYTPTERATALGNLWIVGLSSSSLMFNMYSLLTPIRYSELLFLAPGIGYLIGTCHYIQERDRRVPEDRLRTATLFLGVVSPACMLLYGWAVDQEVKGVALPVIVMLNVYCLDVVQRDGHSGMVVAGNYQIRYMFAAAGSVACLPGIDTMGVGWFSTISAVFMLLTSILVELVVWYGEGWRA
ncbi:major facilitator superfamily domain-containing protein [Aspergillus karnatakaensis]|uniref:major facilitator superfamily domain-containing protein n=1 Tax=Aspergillus karnatakaensis TaxID=1810916 RepID=UPI003CCE2D5B